MQPILDKALLEIMGASGSDPEHCRALAKKLEAWAMQLRLHAESVSTGRASKDGDGRFEPLSGFARN